MIYPVTSGNIERQIDIRLAVIEDIEQLILLNKKWQRNLLGVNTMKGFLSGSFDVATFKRLIADKAVVIAMDGNAVEAYMLSVNHINEGILQEHREVADSLKEKGIIKNDARVAIGIQTAVQEIFHGTGLISLVRNEFRQLLSNRFDYLFTTISKENHRSYKSATNFGWQIVGENEEHYYLILPVTNADAA